MLRIAVCDDDEKDLKIVRILTEELLESLCIEYEIVEFQDGQSLIDSIISFDILLLDIEMDKINGIEIARAIRTNNKISKIIFITNSHDYLQIGYRVKADGYFMKPIDKIEFSYELTNIMKEIIMDNKFIFDKRIVPYKIYLKDILYIEFFDRKTLVHLKDSQIPTSLALKEWVALLGNYHFSQCHKAYIVNLRHVLALKVDSVILANEDQILLSRKYKQDFKTKYYSFIGEWF